MKIFLKSKRFWNTMVLFLIALLGLFADSTLFTDIQDILLLAVAALQLILLFWFSDDKIVLTNPPKVKRGRPRK